MLCDHLDILLEAYNDQLWIQDIAITGCHVIIPDIQSFICKTLRLLQFISNFASMTPLDIHEINSAPECCKMWSYKADNLRFRWIVVTKCKRKIKQLFKIPRDFEWCRRPFCMPKVDQNVRVTASQHLRPKQKKLDGQQMCQIHFYLCHELCVHSLPSPVISSAICSHSDQNKLFLFILEYTKNVSGQLLYIIWRE